MAAEKLSISFDPETIELVRRAASRSGMSLSAWVGRASRREAELDRARAALEEHFARHGEPSAEDRVWARQALKIAGVGLPESIEDATARREALARLDATEEVDANDSTESE